MKTCLYCELSSRFEDSVVHLRSDRGGVLNLFVDWEDDLRFGDCVEHTV